MSKLVILSNLRGNPFKVSLTKYIVKWNSPSKSAPQFATKKFLHNFWSADIVCEEFKIPGTMLRIDLINFTKKIIVETSGKQHEEFVKFFHGNRVGFLKSIKRDFSKIKWAEINGFKFLEIYDHEAKNLSVDFFEKKFNLKL